MNLVRQLIDVFDVAGRRRLAALVALMAIGAIAEALGVGAIMPFLALLTSPEALADYPSVARGLALFGLHTPSEALFGCGALLLAAFVIKNLYLSAMYAVLYKTLMANQYWLAGELFSVYLRAPYRTHASRHSSELARNTSEEARRVMILVALPVLTIAVEGLVIAALLAALLWADPLAALATLAGFGIAGAGFYAIVRARMRRNGLREQRHYGLMIKAVSQGIGALKEIKVTESEDHFLDEFRLHCAEYTSAARTSGWLAQLPRFVIETLAVTTMLGVVLLTLGRGEPLREVLPVLGVFGLAAARMMPSANRIVRAITSLRRDAPALELIRRDLRERVPERAPQSARQEAQPSAPLIEMRGLHFRYEPEGEPVLRGIDLTIRAGESIGIVGPSGSGKTTLVDVLLGLLEPDRGEVLIEGTPLAAHKAAWRAEVGYIAQPTYLLDDTLRRNVAFGVPAPAIDDERVWRALSDAQLGAFARALPAGLDTPVGEQGARLSGGQRQRVGIARALYREPRVLVLDEATSALDNQTEIAITRRIEELARDRTLITIAHRLSTIERCDRIVFVERGAILAAGPYDDLVETCPAFRQMIGQRDPPARLELA